MLFVAACWTWAAMSSALMYRPLVAPGAWVPGGTPHPLRPIARAPVAAFHLLHQLASPFFNIFLPVACVITSRMQRVKFADGMRTAIASQVFCSLASYLTEAVGQWPLRLSPPIYLGLCNFFAIKRLYSLVSLWSLSGAALLFPSRANLFGLEGARWVLRRKGVKDYLTAALRMTALGGMATVLQELAVALPLVETPAFFSSRFVQEERPALHAAFERQPEVAAGKEE